MTQSIHLITQSKDWTKVCHYKLSMWYHLVTLNRCAAASWWTKHFKHTVLTPVLRIGASQECKQANKWCWKREMRVEIIFVIVCLCDAPCDGFPGPFHIVSHVYEGTLVRYASQCLSGKNKWLCVTLLTHIQSNMALIFLFTSHISDVVNWIFILQRVMAKGVYLFHGDLLVSLVMPFPETSPSVLAYFLSRKHIYHCKFKQRSEDEYEADRHPNVYGLDVGHARQLCACASALCRHCKYCQ